MVPNSFSRSWFQCPFKKWTNLWRWNHGIPTSRTADGCLREDQCGRRKSQEVIIPEMKCVVIVLIVCFRICGLLPKNCPNRFSWRVNYDMPFALLPRMKWINLQRWRHPTHYWLFGWKFCSWGYLKSCNYWSWYETLLTKHGDWFSSHPCIYIDFWFNTQSRAKNWPRNACHFAQILQEVVSAWLQAVQRSGHLQSSLVRCDSQSTLQLLGVGQTFWGGSWSCHSGTLNSFVDTFCYCCCCFAITPTRWIPCQTVTPCCSYGQYFSKCRSRDLDSLPTETPSFPYAFLVVNLNVCFTEILHLPKTNWRPLILRRFETSPDVIKYECLSQQQRPHST